MKDGPENSVAFFAGGGVKSEFGHRYCNPTTEVRS